MSTQFGHIEVFARQGSQWRRSVQDVVDEAARKPWACPHVDNPRPAALVAGESLDEMLRRHEAYAAQAKDARGHALRRDTPTLMCGVFSYPVPLAELGIGEARDVQRWMRDTVKWWDAWVLLQGGEPGPAVSHTDESYPHVHLYALNPAGPVEALHPGRRAKKQAFAKALADGMDRKQANKLGNYAYKKSMRHWQDEYWTAVGSKHGLARRGAGTNAVTRAQYLQHKSDTALIAERMAVLARAAEKLGVNFDEILHEVA